MAASLRAFAPLTRPLARRYLAPTLTTVSGAYATRGFASKRTKTPSQDTGSQNSAQEDLQSSSNASESTRATSEEGSELAGKTSDAPLTPPEPLSEALPASSVPSLDFSPGSPGSRTGARSARNTDGPTASQKRAGRLLTFALVAGAGVTIWNLGRDWEEEELQRRRKEPLPMDTGLSGFWKRVWHRAGETVGLLSEPAWEELLPPPLPAPHQKPYTLLLSLDDLLVGSAWDRTHGWRTAKRPGVDYFIAYLSHFYEIVIFTSQPFFHAGPIVEKLDPYSFYVMYRLFREGTRFVDGQVVKDLSFLNRDLSKVVALDTHPEHYGLQPENSVIVKPWDGKPGDKGLVALIPFLESIAIYKPDDVRPILEKYHGKDVPIEYAIEEAKHKEVFLQEWREKNKGRLNPSGGLGSGGFTISSLFGGGGAPRPAVANEPLTYLEQKRREAQQEYLAEQAYLQKNEGEIKKMIEDEMKERDRMAKEAGGSIAALVGTLINGPPDPSTLAAPAASAPAPAGPPPSATQVLQGATQSGKQ